MYIRNYTTNFVPEGTLAANQNMVVNFRNNQPVTVPVKSFPDSSAYEVFNNIGKNQEKIVTQEEIVPENTENHADDNTDQIREEKEEKYTLIDTSKNTNDTVSSIVQGFLKIKSFFDFDVIILAVLIAVIFLNKESDDKLTPLALLAIMFL